MANLVAPDINAGGIATQGAYLTVASNVAPGGLTSVAKGFGPGPSPPGAIILASPAVNQLINDPGVGYPS
jgi:hypothetical protein